MGKPYSSELDILPNTYDWVLKQDSQRLRRLLELWKGDHLYVVGSGGSFAAATAVAQLRELSHQSPTTALTPMDFIARAPSLPKSRVLLLSAEGKNSDILAAADIAGACDLTCAALTLTPSNPLLSKAHMGGTLRAISYEMPWGKDGFLATNSLVATVLLALRALFDEKTISVVSKYFSSEGVSDLRRLYRGNQILCEARYGNVTVLFDPAIAAAAVDLESKIAESSLAHVQLADFRQFAHGRHLQLSKLTRRTTLIALCTNLTRQLAEKTLELAPIDVRTAIFEVPALPRQSQIAVGVLMSTLLLEGIAFGADYDPGNPDVPEFGRQLHKMDISTYLSAAVPEKLPEWHAALRKARHGWSVGICVDTIIPKAVAFKDKLEQQVFKAIICDFDGTLCNAEDRFEGMDSSIRVELGRLIEEGLQVGIVSGRGASLRGCLLDAVPKEHHSDVWVAYYSGSAVCRLSDPLTDIPGNPLFSILISWLKQTSFHNIEDHLRNHGKGGQLSIDAPGREFSASLKDVIEVWIADNGLNDWRVYCSGHSIDILDGETSKGKASSRIAEILTLRPEHDILFIGDSGNEAGNDYELLNGPNSLSSDKVSSSLATCWNFSPAGASHAASTLYYLKSLAKIPTGFQLKLRQ